MTKSGALIRFKHGRASDKERADDLGRILDILWKTNGCKDIVATFDTDPNGVDKWLYPTVKALAKAQGINHRALLQHLLQRRYGTREVTINNDNTVIQLTADLEAFTTQDIKEFTRWCLEWGKKRGIKLNPPPGL